MKFQTREPQNTGMQIAPMIDIVFLLLIFFIVTWQFSREEMDLRIAVPTSEEGADPQRVLGEIILNVRVDGTVTVWGETKNKAQLKQTLSAIALQHENQPVRVRGDATTPFQRIVEVIDTCQQAGIWNISFATEKPRPSE
ncbi:ExbD/TolR family protein [Haloferula rosea]|uniref:Biopolymer transporter ExbD n=1 Tax=Haloferula rosea TaxID=490093 RepID=A0A934RHL8_9BACT|nr:biopolymer transporter ExbD [Haloferula rosea]MBK1828681.1 biopolymer transporter ExbD [Haloferula rosea]